MKQSRNTNNNTNQKTWRQTHTHAFLKIDKGGSAENNESFCLKNVGDKFTTQIRHSVNDNK